MLIKSIYAQTIYIIAALTIGAIGACDGETDAGRGLAPAEVGDGSAITPVELGFGDESVVVDGNWVALDSAVLRCVNDEGMVEEVSGRALVHSDLDVETLAGDERVLRSCALETPLDGPRQLSAEPTEPQSLTCVAIEVCCWHIKLICGPSKPPTQKQ